MPPLKLLDEFAARLLEEIGKEGSISGAAKELGCSYKRAWLKLKELEVEVGSVVEKRRGREGWTRLTKLGEELLIRHKRLRLLVEEDKCMLASLSARNRLRGRLRALRRSGLVAQLEIEVRGPVFLKALITREAAEALRLKPGEEVEAVIKATEILVAKP